jgi:hypothetical protein
LDEPGAWTARPAGEGDYVKRNGFGHEDWNFNDLATGDYIYSYAYYEPDSRKKSELFQFAFSTYQASKWHLVAFYLDATFVSNGIPLHDRILNEKKRHLLELKAQNSLGGAWSSLSGERIIRKLTPI